MKIESIKCNGLTGGFGSATLNVQSTIQAAVADFRMRHKNIFEMMPPARISYYAGVRFNSDEDVKNRVCSGLYEAATKEVAAKSAIPVYAAPEQFVEVVIMIENFIENINSADMDTIILEGMRDCAESDYWYTFEKSY